MKGYFWADLKNGLILNWEAGFRLFRRSRPMDILWELALETGAVDEVQLTVPESPSLNDVVLFAERGDKFFDAYLTVAEGRRLKGAKFRLTGIKLVGCELAQAQAAEKKKTASSGVWDVDVLFERCERARFAQPGGNPSGS